MTHRLMQEGAECTTHQNGQDLSKDRRFGLENLSRSFIPTVCCFMLACNSLVKLRNYMLKPARDFIFNPLSLLLLLEGSSSFQTKYIHGQFLLIYSSAATLQCHSTFPFACIHFPGCIYRQKTFPSHSHFFLLNETNQILSVPSRRKALISDNSRLFPARASAWIHPSWTQVATTASRNSEAASTAYYLMSHIAQATAFLIQRANATIPNCCLLPPVCLIAQVWAVFVSKQMSLPSLHWFTARRVHLHFYLNNKSKQFHCFCAGFCYRRCFVFKSYVANLLLWKVGRSEERFHLQLIVLQNKSLSLVHVPVPLAQRWQSPHSSAL